MRPATETTTTEHNMHKGGHATHSKKNGAGRGLTALLVPLLLLHFLALLALCAYVTDRWIEGSSAALRAFTFIAVPIMVLLTLIAASVGVATMIMGMIHGKQWSESSRSSSVGSNLVTFGLLALAFGFACKVLDNGLPDSTLGRILKAIAALVIISTVVHLLYLFTLGLFKRHDTTTTTTHHDTAPIAAGAAGYGAGHHHHTGTTRDTTYAAPATAGAAGYGAGHHNAGTTGYGHTGNTGTLAGNNTNLGGGDVRSLESGTHPTAGHKNFVGGHEVP